MVAEKVVLGVKDGQAHGTFSEGEITMRQLMIPEVTSLSPHVLLENDMSTS